MTETSIEPDNYTTGSVQAFLRGVAVELRKAAYEATAPPWNRGRQGAGRTFLMTGEHSFVAGLVQPKNIRLLLGSSPEVIESVAAVIDLAADTDDTAMRDAVFVLAARYDRKMSLKCSELLTQNSGS